MIRRIVKNLNMRQTTATLFQGNQTRQKQLKQESKNKSKIKTLK